MIQFKYRDTVIIKSEIDFTRLGSLREFSGDANLSTAIVIPRQFEQEKSIRCAVELLIGGENERVKIHVKTYSVFELEQMDDAMSVDMINNDARLICLPKALEELSNRLSELTRIHLGAALSIPIPQIIE